MSEHPRGMVRADDDSDFNEELARRDMRSVGDITADKNVAPDDDRLDCRIQEAEADRLDQANDLRKSFFWFAVATAGICTLVSVVTVIILACVGRGSEAIFTAFISGLSVEALGVTAIMARYLFSHPSRDGN